LENGAADAADDGLGQEPFQLVMRCRVGETLVQLGKLGNVALEQLTQMGDLSDQLLVGTGFAPEEVSSAGIPTIRAGLLRWWTRYPSTSDYTVDSKRTS